MVRTILIRTKQEESKIKNFIRKITKTARYTYYVTIPKSEMESLGWREHQKVVVRRVGKKLVIEDWKQGD